MFVFRLGLDFSRLASEPGMVARFGGAVVLLSAAYVLGGWPSACSSGRTTRRCSASTWPTSLGFSAALSGSAILYLVAWGLMSRRQAW